jgi:phosphoribosylformylglycinamidine (FGAM) synthase-like amidotransferase family enzyme
LLESPLRTKDFQILCIPGGFSYGDDIAAGRILANQIRHHLRDALQQFKADGKLILGICNGFQVLIKAGVLLADSDTGEPATLTWNKTGRFQDRWIHLAANGDRCVFLRGIERMYLSIAHAEGRFVTRDADVLHQLHQNSQLALRYAPGPKEVSAGNSAIIEANGEELPFPINPNGSAANVAGLCDETGRVFGLMPHPERHIERTQHPRWTRGEGRDPGDGLAVFQNAVRYFAN